MKRSIKLILFTILIIFGLAIKVNAAEKYTLSNPKQMKVGSLSNNQYNISSTKAAYCLSPNKPHGTNYTVTSVVNPTNSLYELALSIAYTYYLNDGKITKDGQESGAVISATFRLIAKYYKVLDEDCSYNADGSLYAGCAENKYYEVEKKKKGTFKGKLAPKLIDKWKKDGKIKSGAQYAINLFNTVVNLVNSAAGATAAAKFQNLQNFKILFKSGASYSFTPKVTKTETINSSKKRITFTITTTAGSINWNDFKCKYNCSSLKKVSASGKTGTYTAEVPAAAESFKITASYNTRKNVDGRLKFMTSSESAKQLMILVDSELKKMPDQEVTINLTPSPPPIPPACTIQINPTTGAKVYYGKTGITDVETYRSECVRNCTYIESENKYYCKNEDLDKSGPECSYEQWVKQCTYCGKNEEICTTNPDDPNCPEEYWQNCPNCNPSADMPDSCNDFDTNSEVKGTINDLNVKKSSCNRSEYPVKGCVIGGKDIAGNAYAMADTLKDNRYCRAYCIEDYQFFVPTARYSTSGGYFELAMKIIGKRNCYLGPPRDEPKNDENTSYETIDYAKFKADFNTYQQKVKSSYDAKNYGEALNAYNELNKIINEYKDCTTLMNRWTNDLNFEPKIDYTYNDYINKYNAGTFSKVEGTETTEVTNTYCYGQTDSQYNCLGNKIVTDQDVPEEGAKIVNDENVLTEESPYETIEYYECVGTSANATCTLKTDRINKAIGVQKSIEKTAIFAPSQKFDSYHQYGTVKTGNICANANLPGYENCLWTRLPDEALPVELKTGKGAFPFTLSISDVGQYADGRLGRLLGNENSVLNKFNELDESKKCIASDDPESSTPKYSKYTQDVGYVCAYINNCDECDVECKGKDCILKTCEDCDVRCRTCIFDGQNSTYKYRTISLNNVFPNKCGEGGTEGCREEGYNWNTKNVATSEVSKKAAATIEEIEKDGEKAYEEKKQYSYTLNPAQLSAIRNYNKEVGTYANTQMPYNEVFKNNEAALQCQQVTYENGITYSVKCLSTFLNDETGTYFTSNMQRSDTTKFKLWTETGNCINGSCLSRVDGIGPSWK